VGTSPSEVPRRSLNVCIERICGLIQPIVDDMAHFCSIPRAVAPPVIRRRCAVVMAELNDDKVSR
jgi:hypothetical protein